MIARPTGPVIFFAPFWVMASEPLPEWVTENRAIVVASIVARWSAIVPSISQ